MRIYYKILFFLLWCFGAQQLQAEDTGLPFSLGEKMKYSIYAAKWKVGYQTIELHSVKEWNETPVYLLKGLSRSSPLLSIFYRLNDQWDIYMRMDSFIPLRVEKDWQEGKDEGYYVYDIDQQGKTVTLRNMKSGKNKIMNAKNTVFDLFSLVYYYRLNYTAFDEIYAFDFLESRGVKTVYFQNEGSMEVRIPQIAVNHMLKVRKLKQIGDVGIEIYISDDSLRIPLKILAPSKLPKNKVIDIEFILDEYYPGPDQKVLPSVYKFL